MTTISDNLTVLWNSNTPGSVFDKGQQFVPISKMIKTCFRDGEEVKLSMHFSLMDSFFQPPLDRLRYKD